MRSLNVIGLNSGTSMDGIDAALFCITPHPNGNISATHPIVPQLSCQLLDSVLVPFDPSFQNRLKKLVGNGDVTLEEVCLVNTALGELFAQAAKSLINKNRQTTVDLIGSHGQTIWHSPTPRSFWGVNTAGTLQVGEPAIIAARTGLPVVADFRPTDLAFHGEGAPLVCFADQVLFGKPGQPTGVLNIGGIANITIINKDGLAVQAFDTGPGNMLIDRAAQQLLGQECDQDGSVAARGKIDESWLQELLSEPYFHRRPPKTTGRELFGFAYADALIKMAKSRGLDTADCLATLTALTAASIFQAYDLFIASEIRIERLVVGGGGADNKFLMQLLASYFAPPITIHRHEDFGISTKFKEALLFALLAYTTFFKIANNVPACTGADRKVCLGKLVMP